MKMVEHVFHVYLTILLTVFYTETYMTEEQVIVSRGDRISLNCSKNLSEMTRYTSHWEFVNMSGYRITKDMILHLKGKTSDASFRIDKATIYDIGKYNCTIGKTLPPPIKNFTTLIQLIVKAPPQMILKSTIGDQYNVTAHCSLQEFYPENVNVSFNASCGSVQHLKNPVLTRNADGTYNTSYTFLVNIYNCTGNIKGTCAVEHQTGRFNISAQLLEGRPDALMPKNDFTWYIIGGVLILLLFIYIIYKTGKGRCSAVRVCYTSRQKITSSTDLTSQSMDERDREIDNIDIVYLKPIFKREDTKKAKIKEMETEYSALRLMTKN
ncbi:tyrosine-protein phosphatase non-receptor type substrate 1-like [Phyllobates terribilis]|uniref:tyrosine-protein phosphatase non-receptor type substrate 1-like n=1 Tax=Phyllobates terribilis TaxID=111132 RepID=UPI003CCB5D93